VTSDEVWDLLGVIAVADRRTVGDADHKMWTALVGDLAFSDCQAAVVGHYRDSTDWIMAKHIRDRVAEIRQERLRAAGPVEIPEELADSPAEALAWKQERLTAIADGRMQPRAIGGTR
jgi:hypothetical protein